VAHGLLLRSPRRRRALVPAPRPLIAVPATLAISRSSSSAATCGSGTSSAGWPSRSSPTSAPWRGDQRAGVEHDGGDLQRPLGVIRTSAD